MRIVKMRKKLITRLMESVSLFEAFKSLSVLLKYVYQQLISVKKHVNIN